MNRRICTLALSTVFTFGCGTRSDSTEGSLVELKPPYRLAIPADLPDSVVTLIGDGTTEKISKREAYARSYRDGFDDCWNTFLLRLQTSRSTDSFPAILVPSKNNGLIVCPAEGSVLADAHLKGFHDCQDEIRIIVKDVREFATVEKLKSDFLR